MDSGQCIRWGKSRTFPSSQKVLSDSTVVSGTWKQCEWYATCGKWKHQLWCHEKKKKGSPRANAAKTFLGTILEERLGQQTEQYNLIRKTFSAKKMNTRLSVLLAWILKHPILISCPDYILVVYLLSVQLYYLPDCLTSLNLHFLPSKRGIVMGSTLWEWELILIANSYRVLTMCQAFFWKFY